MNKFSSAVAVATLLVLIPGCGEPPLWKGDVPTTALAGTWVISGVPEDLEDAHSWIGKKAFVLELDGTAKVLFGPVPKLFTGVDITAGTGHWWLYGDQTTPATRRTWELHIFMTNQPVFSTEIVRKARAVALLKVYNPNYGTFFLFEKRVAAP